MAEHPAVVRRVPDRATDVRSGLQTRQSSGKRRCRSSGAPTGYPLDVIGVVRRAVDRVVALKIGQTKGHVRLAENHRSRPLQSADRERVFRCNILCKIGHAMGGGEIGDVIAFLDRHRHTVQRPPNLAPRKGRIRRGSRLTSTITIVHHNRIDALVIAVNPLQVVVEQL